jgi:hypothetical protein
MYAKRSLLSVYLVNELRSNQMDILHNACPLSDRRKRKTKEVEILCPVCGSPTIRSHCACDKCQQMFGGKSWKR